MYLYRTVFMLTYLKKVLTKYSKVQM